MTLTTRDMLLLRRIWELEAAIHEALGSGNWEELSRAMGPAETPGIPPAPWEYFMMEREDFDWSSPEADARTEAYIANLQIERDKRNAYVKVMRADLLSTARSLGIQAHVEHVGRAAEAAVWWMVGP